uniref:NfeD family protein n=1 Tax=Halovivax sp. TaxID=1935978 RepID=UPI0025C55A9F
MVEEIVPGGLPVLLLTVGIALSIAEALAPGAHLIVLGVALIVAGIVGLLFAEIGLLGGLGLSLVLALTVLITGAISLFVYREFDFYGGKGVARTSDSTSLRGATGRVTERVTPTSGVVKLDRGGFSPHYQARSMDDEIPEGTEVIVADPGGGNVLRVA